MIVVDYSSVSIVQIMGALQGDNKAEIDVNAFRHLMLFQILEYKNKYGKRFGDLVFAVDNELYWRREIFPHYKCYRKKNKEDQGYDWDMIHKCMDQFEAELRELFPYPVINADFAEADDVIAVMAEWSQKNDLKDDMFDESFPKDFLIISADGDACQLQKYKNVKQISPYTKEQVLPKLDIGGVKTKVPLDQYILDHLLTGDAGDSIPNILTEDDFFQKKLDNPDTKMRQKPVTAKIKQFYLDQLNEEGVVSEFRSPQEKINFKRNNKLINFDHIPKYVKENVIGVYESQTDKDRSMVLDYLIKNKIKNLIDNAQDF